MTPEKRQDLRRAEMQKRLDPYLGVGAAPPKPKRFVNRKGPIGKKRAGGGAR